MAVVDVNAMVDSTICGDDGDATTFGSNSSFLPSLLSAAAAVSLGAAATGEAAATLEGFGDAAADIVGTVRTATGRATHRVDD
jgi:hypothetical protein